MDWRRQAIIWANYYFVYLRMYNAKNFFLNDHRISTEYYPDVSYQR